LERQERMHYQETFLEKKGGNAGMHHQMFPLGGTSGCRFKESNHRFFFRKSDGRESIKASFSVNRVHPCGGSKAIPTLH